MTQMHISHIKSPSPALSPPLCAAKALRILGLDLLLVLLIAGIIEAGLQVAHGSCDRPQLFDADYTGGKPYAANAQALRGPLVPQTKRQGEFRLLGLGDSTTFGTGIAWEEAWPNQCATMLASTLQRDITGINAGVPAASVKDMGYAIDHAWGELQPDVVLLVVSGNLVSLAWIRRDETGAMPFHPHPPAGSIVYQLKTSFNRTLKYLRLPVLLTQTSERAAYAIGLQNHAVRADAPYGAMLAHGWRQLGLDPRLADQAWRRFERDLITLRDRVRARGARFYVASLPARFTLDNRPENNEKSVPLHRLSISPGERLQEICDRIAVANIDLTKPLQEALHTEATSLYIPMDYTHLSPAGQRVVARAIAQRITSDLRPDRTSEPTAVQRNDPQPKDRQARSELDRETRLPQLTEAGRSRANSTGPVL
jgi:lysophospholipase L1-like esterase